MTASVKQSPARRRLLLASDRSDSSSELVDILQKVGEVDVVPTSDIPEMPPSERTISTVASSMKLMQSHRMLPVPVRSSRARWPIAKAGMVPIPSSPGSYWRNALKCVRSIAGNVVQDWPSRFTYCRSSWQIVQLMGGVSPGG